MAHVSERDARVLCLPTRVAAVHVRVSEDPRARRRPVQRFYHFGIRVRVVACTEESPGRTTMPRSVGDLHGERPIGASPACVR